MNICAGLKAGKEGAIHAVRKQEELIREETGTERRERLESAEKTRLREDLERKRERIQQGSALATIPEEREGKRKPRRQRLGNYRTCKCISVVEQKG